MRAIRSCKTAMYLLAAMPAWGLGLGMVIYAAPRQDAPRQEGGDAVADAARKAREHLKDTPKPKKVYTDDDVKKPEPAAPETPATGSAAAPEGGQPAGANAPAPAQGADKNGDKNDEATWRKRFQAQRDKITFAEKELDVLQREMNKAEVQYYPDPQKALEQQYTRKDIVDKQAKIDAKKDEIAKLKQGLNDLEDELRKEGGDPGWARE
jgi:hypothetical protein